LTNLGRRCRCLWWNHRASRTYYSRGVEKRCHRLKDCAAFLRNISRSLPLSCYRRMGSPCASWSLAPKASSLEWKRPYQSCSLFRYTCWPALHWRVEFRVYQTHMLQVSNASPSAPVAVFLTWEDLSQKMTSLGERYLRLDHMGSILVTLLLLLSIACMKQSKGWYPTPLSRFSPETLSIIQSGTHLGTIMSIKVSILHSNLSLKTNLSSYTVIWAHG